MEIWTECELAMNIDDHVCDTQNLLLGLWSLLRQIPQRKPGSVDLSSMYNPLVL